MSDASVKMGVTGISQFKQGMNQAQQSVKTLDAALKLNEKQLQATGDKETYMQQKSKLLQQQIAAQNTVIKQGQQALAAMEKNGVTPASQAYQKMQQQVLNAQTALLGMHGDLDSVGESAQETAEKTDKLAESLNGINKKVSFDAVLNGIGKITDGMEAAGHKIEAIARNVWDTMATAAAWADNENTLAAMYGIDVETLQRMQYAAEYAETSVDTIIKSQQKLKNNMVYGSDDVMQAFEKLGVSIETVDGKTGILGRIADFVARYNGEEATRGYRDATDVFWELGEALQNYGDAVERDAMAQKIFGTSWQQLIPMFSTGRKKYAELLEEAPTVDQENVDKLNQLSDALVGLQSQFQTLEKTVLSELAPGFTELSNSFSGLLSNFNEYLKTDEGKEKLEAMSQAVTDLFTGLSDIDFGTAIDTASGILDTVTESLGWISKHSGEVVAGIEAIGAAFLALKAAEVVGSLAQGAAALKNLLGNGGGNAPASAGKALQTAGQSAGNKDYTESWIDTSLAVGAWFKRIGTAVSTALKTATPYAAFGATVIGAGNVVDSMGTKRYEEFEEQMSGIAEASTDASDSVQEMYKTLDILGQAYKGDTNVREAFKLIDPETLRQVMPQSDLFNWLDNVYGGNWNAFLDDSSTSGTVLMEYAEEFATGFASALAALQDADKPSVEVMPEMAPDAASLLQEQANGFSVSIPAYPDLSSVSVDGTHANGLPFVPFDGYIAALHKGERVVPASQNKSVNFVNNNYFDRPQMYNNTDVQGLAAAIAERNRHNLQGVGG